jgi:hypothetical protein
MKAYIYFLSLLLTFAPVYANAILPGLTAVAGSKAGKVVLTKTGGAVLRTLSPTSIASMAKTTVGICAKNPLAFAFCTAVISAIKGDGLDITINNNETNDVDVEISRRTQDKCTEYCDPNYQYCFASPEILGRHYFNLDVERFRKEGTILSSYQYKDYRSRIVYFSYTERYDVVGSTESTINTSHFVKERKTDCSNTVLSDSEINQYFNKYVSDDDITNIYNYDYSQHTTIKVNSDIDTGDNINNKIKNSNSENDKEMTETAAQKSKQKNSDYHPDKIDDENCSKDDMGRYDKCGTDRDNDDDDTASTPSSTTPPTNPPDDEEPPPIECNSNGFYKKVCDWMDWTQDDYSADEDTKPSVTDKAQDIELKKDRIDFSESCPPPKHVTVGYILDKEISYDLDYSGFCDSMIMLNPYIEGFGIISSILIIAGVGRKNG